MGVMVPCNKILETALAEKAGNFSCTIKSY